MTSYKIHNENTVSAPAAELLKKAKDKYGFIPNLLGMMAEAPALLKAYMTLGGIFDETSFSPTEKQIVLLTISSANGCSYCMAAHSMIAGMQGVPEDVINSLRQNVSIKDTKLEALHRFSYAVVETRGYPSEETVKQFLAAGYNHAQILEVVLGVGFKTLSNYTNHIAHTPLDDAFKKTEWEEADTA